jgi:hypothetical protein
LDDERQGIINYLSVHPRAGVLMQGIGGIHKFSWVSGNKGKSSGVRVTYHFHNESEPLFLLSVVANSERANLTHSERNELAKLTNYLIKNYGDTNVCFFQKH